MTSGYASFIRGILSYQLAAFCLGIPAVEVVAGQSCSCQLTVGVCVCTHGLVFHAQRSRCRSCIALISVEYDSICNLLDAISYQSIISKTSDRGIASGCIVSYMAAGACISYTGISQGLAVQRGQLQGCNITRNYTILTLVGQYSIVRLSCSQTVESSNALFIGSCSCNRSACVIYAVIQGDLNVSSSRARTRALCNLIGCGSSLSSLCCDNQFIIGQAGNIGGHSVKRTFRANGQSVILFTGNLKLNSVRQGVNDCIVNSDRSRTVCKIRSVGKCNVLAARGYMNYVLGRDTILILVNLNGEGQVIVFRGILCYSVSRSQNATSLGYGRQSIVDEIYILAVDIFTLDVGQGTNIFKGYIQGFVIKVQTLNALISHVTDVPSAAVVVPALFIAGLSRLDVVAIRQRYQAISLFRISGDTDVCTGGRTSNVQSCLVIEVYIVLRTRGLIVVNYNVVLNSCICGLADVQTGTLLGSLVASYLYVIRNMQAAVGLSLCVSVYASAISCGVVSDFSIIRDVDLAAVAHKERTAASGCCVTRDNNACTNVQNAAVSCQCTCAALHSGYVVNTAACYICVGKSYSTIVSHVDYTAIIAASRTVKINMVEVYSSAVCYFDKTRLSANRGRTSILNLVIRGTIRREIDSLRTILKLKFLRCADVRHQHDVDFVLVSCSLDSLANGHKRGSFRAVAANITAACGAVGYIISGCCGYEGNAVISSILCLSCRGGYIVESILSFFVRRNVRGNFLPFRCRLFCINRVISSLICVANITYYHIIAYIDGIIDCERCRCKREKHCKCQDQ